MGTKAKHGLSHTPLYGLFDNMKERCYNPNHIGWKDYGGRGIIICEEWLNDFTYFYTWAIYNGWKPNLQIDRFPDKNGNYEPNNCRFATPKENCRNRRNNLLIEYENKTKCAAEWAEITEIPAHTIIKRYKKGSHLFSPIKQTLLSNEDIIKIYKSAESIKNLCNTYSCHRLVIWRIKNGVTYNTITEHKFIPQILLDTL